MTGRTTAEVLQDPRNAELVHQADDAFAQAERASTAEEAFEHFGRGVRLMRLINDAERQRSALVAIIESVNKPMQCARGCTSPCAQQEGTGWCRGMS